MLESFWVKVPMRVLCVENYRGYYVTHCCWVAHEHQVFQSVMSIGSSQRNFTVRSSHNKLGIKVQGERREILSSKCVLSICYMPCAVQTTPGECDLLDTRLRAVLQVKPIKKRSTVVAFTYYTYKRQAYVRVSDISGDGLRLPLRTASPTDRSHRANNLEQT